MKRTSILLAAILLTSILAAFTPITEAQIESKLVLISPISRASIKPMQDAFTAYIKAKHNVDVAVEIISGSSPELLAKVEAWSGKPDADVFWGGEYAYYPRLVGKGLLEAYKSAYWDQLPADFQGFALKDANGYWMAVSFYCPGIMLNKDLLAKLKLPEPKAWSDLLDSKYKDQIIMTTPARSGGLHMDVEVLLQSRGEKLGWAYWRRLSVNVGKWAARSLEVSSLVEKGEYAIGIAIAETSAILSKKAGYNVGFLYPDTAFVVPSPIAILKGTARPKIAQEFMDFILSKEAQGQILLSGGLVPSRKDVRFSDYATIPDAVIMKEFMKAENVYGLAITNFAINFDLYDKRFSEVNTMFEDTITKKIDDLLKAWSSIQDAQKTVAEAEKKIVDLEKQGYDVSKAKDVVGKAKPLVNEALESFDAGKYGDASSAAAKAKEQAGASVGLARKLEWYELVEYQVGMVVALALVVLTLFWAAKKREKKK